jgi:hypothetical protein
MVPALGQSIELWRPVGIRIGNTPADQRESPGNFNSIRTLADGADPRHRPNDHWELGRLKHVESDRPVTFWTVCGLRDESLI